MPRKNLTGTLQNERNIAERIIDERRERGLSHEGLAKLVTEAGVPLNGSAIYWIENGDPPRTISFNEAVALAEVFGTSVEDLAVPKELRDQQKARDVAKELAAAATLLDEGHAAVVRAAIKLVSVADMSPELFEFVVHQALSNMKDKKQWFGEFVGGPVNSMALSYLAEIADKFWDETMRMASGHAEEAT